MDFNEGCPVCGGIMGYHINSYGRIVRQCRNCKHIIADDIVAPTNKTTFTGYNQSATTVTNTSSSNGLRLDIDPMYSIAPPQPLTLEIKCNSITLKQNDISIRFCSEKDIKKFDSIIINGIKFKKVVEEEDNDC